MTISKKLFGKWRTKNYNDREMIERSSIIFEDLLEFERNGKNNE